MASDSLSAPLIPASRIRDDAVSVGEFTQRPRTDSQGDIGAKESAVGGTVGPAGQKAMDLLSLRPALPKLTADHKLGHAFLPDGSSNRAKNCALLMVDAAGLPDHVLAPPSGCTMSQNTTVHAEETQLYESLAISAEVVGPVGSGGMSGSFAHASKKSKKYAKYHTTAQLKFSCLGLEIVPGGAFKVNPALEDEIKALNSYLKQERQGGNVPGEDACEKIKLLFDKWGFFLPSRCFMGLMATCTNTIKVKSTLTQEEAKMKADVNGASVLQAFRTAAEHSTTQANAEDDRDTTTSFNFVSGAATAHMGIQDAYQLGDHRHDVNAWRVIEVRKGASVLNLVAKEHSAYIKEALRSNWFLGAPHYLEDKATYEIVPSFSPSHRIDVKVGFTATNGSKLHLWRPARTWYGTRAQRFKVYRVEDQFYSFEPLCADGKAIHWQADNVVCCLDELSDSNQGCHFKLEPTGDEDNFLMKTRNGGKRVKVERSIFWTNLVAQPNEEKSTRFSEFKFVRVPEGE